MIFKTKWVIKSIHTIACARGGRSSENKQINPILGLVTMITKMANGRKGGLWWEVVVSDCGIQAKQKRVLETGKIYKEKLRSQKLGWDHEAGFMNFSSNVTAKLTEKCISFLFSTNRNFAIFCLHFVYSVNVSFQIYTYWSTSVILCSMYFP